MLTDNKENKRNYDRDYTVDNDLKTSINFKVGNLAATETKIKWIVASSCPNLSGKGRGGVLE